MDNFSWRAFIEEQYDQSSESHPVFYDGVQATDLRQIFDHECVRNLEELLQQSNGVGDAFSMVGEEIAANCLIMNYEEIVTTNLRLRQNPAYQDLAQDVLIFSPNGQDGIVYGLSSEGQVMMLLPLDRKSVKVAKNLSEFLRLLLQGAL